MAQRYALEVLALYLIAAASCGSDSPGGEPAGGAGGAKQAPGGAGGQSAGVSGQSAGVGGRVAGASGGGSGGQLSRGDECNPDAGTPECGGGYWDWDGCKPRYVTEACYLAEAPNGDPACLPVDDPGLVARLRDINFSAVFLPEFIIAAAPTRALPASCEAHIACCDGRSGTELEACFDKFDRIRAADNPEWTCPEQAACSADQADAGESDVADADAGVESKHSLCCYDACGHTQDT